MRKRDGHYCCDCNLCGVSQCDKTPAEAVFFLHQDGTPYHHDYFLFCWGHRSEAFTRIRAYLAAHPGLVIDEQDGSWRDELAMEFQASLASV